MLVTKPETYISENASFSLNIRHNQVLISFDKIYHLKLLR